MPMTAREEILQRIRTALTPDPTPVPIPRAYDRLGTLAPEARIELLIDRLVDYDTEILHAATESAIPAAIAKALTAAAETRVITPAAFPTAWLPTGFHITLDTGLPKDQIEGIPAVITTCEAAVASTGTIFLVHSGAQGRRIVTLLPDHHIILLHHDQVYELLPEALEAVRPHAAAPLTTISGPSATSDIEMTRIRGVHGPRRLTVILYGA